MDIPDLDKLKNLAAEHSDAVDKGIDALEKFGHGKGGAEGAAVDKAADALRNMLGVDDNASAHEGRGPGQGRAGRAGNGGGPKGGGHRPGQERHRPGEGGGQHRPHPNG